LSYTIGQSEITVITTSSIFEEIESKNLFAKQNLTFLNKNLGAVTVRFGHDVVRIPNVTFEVLKLVALNNTNIIETISTSQELTLVVEQKDVKYLSGIMQGRIG
jgi:hypothetical protein